MSVVLGSALYPARADDQALQERVDRQEREIEALKKQVQELRALVGQKDAKDAEAAKPAAESAPATSVPPLRSRSPSGDFSVQVVGTLQLTTGFYGGEDAGPRAPDLNDGLIMRRAHLGITGVAFKDFTHTSVFDLAATGGVASSVRDLTVAYTGFAPFIVTLGNQKPQSGLEASFSDRSNAQTFLEPALTSDIVTALSTRYLGVRLSTGSTDYSASLGLFGDDINNNGVAVPQKTGWGMHGRLTYAPIATSDALVHLGVSGFWRHIGTGRATGAADPLASQLRFRSRPELTVDGQRLVDSGNLASARNVKFMGAEFAAIQGPFGVQSEYQRVWVDQGPAKLGLSFDGAYVEGSYFFTGESRVYDPKTGVFTRFRPKANFAPDRGSWGALEAAARVSFVDYNDHATQLAAGGIKGGYEINYTAALNWYWNTYFRLQANFIRANVRNGGGASSRGLDANIVALRAHQEW